ncbi:hypothetical protein MRX96_006579 [Rhipicephalus microplus]
MRIPNDRGSSSGNQWNPPSCVALISRRLALVARAKSQIDGGASPLGGGVVRERYLFREPGFRRVNIWQKPDSRPRSPLARHLPRFLFLSLCLPPTVDSPPTHVKGEGRDGVLWEFSLRNGIVACKHSVFKVAEAAVGYTRRQSALVRTAAGDDTCASSGCAYGRLASGPNTTSTLVVVPARIRAASLLLPRREKQRRRPRVVKRRGRYFEVTPPETGSMDHSRLLASKPPHEGWLRGIAA